MPAETSVALSPEELLSRVAREAWDLFKENGLTLVVGWLLVALVSGLTLGLAAGTLHVGFILVVRRLRRGDQPNIGDMMHFGHFVGGLLATLLIVLGVSVGLMLLIVPGLLLSVMWMFALHHMAYEDMGAVSAMKASWATAKDAFVHVLVLMVVFTVLNGIAGAVMFASLLTVPFTLVALTIAFEVLTGQTPPTSALPEHAGPGEAPQGQQR